MVEKVDGLDDYCKSLEERVKTLESYHTPTTLLCLYIVYNDMFVCNR